ncbi:MAG: DUF4271 domain-containing protein [Flavobacterium sp.]|jgi:hypothetical protein|nr:DUF4271 domain-containing protein [Flavobacterium sp.]
MIEQVLHPRIVENKDWATALFLFSLVLIALSKSLFENRFSEFIKLIVSDKYLKVYKDSGLMMSWFTIFLFIVQILSFSFFIHLLLNSFGYTIKTDWISYIQIFTFLTVFILSKYLIEKIIGTAFEIEEFVEQFNLQKVSYRTFIGLFLLPINCFLYYNDSISRNLILFFLFIILITNVLTYLLSIKNYQNILFGNLFYFILYLCALEIAPYYFMYYWFTKN